MLKCSLFVWPFANRLHRRVHRQRHFLVLSAMAKASASSGERVAVDLELAKFQIACPQCCKTISRTFDPSRWGADEDYDLRNRLSQHTWSTREHEHMNVEDCNTQEITVWDTNFKNEFEYMDPRQEAQTTVTTEPPQSSVQASSHVNNNGVKNPKTKDWMNQVIERLNRIEDKVDQVQKMLRSSVTKSQSRSRSRGRHLKR